MLFGKSNRFHHSSKKIDDGERLVILPSLEAHHISSMHVKNSEFSPKKVNGLAHVKNNQNSPLQETFSLVESDEQSIYATKNALKAVLSPRITGGNQSQQSMERNIKFGCFQNVYDNQRIDNSSANQIVIPTAPIEKNVKSTNNSFQHKSRQLRSSFPINQDLIAVESIKGHPDSSTLQSYLDSLRQSGYNLVSTERSLNKNVNGSISRNKKGKAKQHSSCEEMGLIKTVEENSQNSEVALMLVIGGSSYSLKSHAETLNGKLKNRVDTKISNDVMAQLTEDTSHSDKWTNLDTIKEVCIHIPENIAQNIDDDSNSNLLQKHLEYYQTFPMNGVLLSTPASPPVPDFEICGMPIKNQRLSDDKEIFKSLIDRAIVNAVDCVESIVNANKRHDVDCKVVTSSQ